MDVSEKQSMNADDLIVLSCDPCSKVTFAKASQPANAPASIVTSVLGRVIFCNILLR